MTTNEQQKTRKPGTPETFSQWMQRTMTASGGGGHHYPVVRLTAR